MKNCIGIISWLPAEPENRKLRRERIKRLLKQINLFWPDIDILLIAQNWKNTTVPKISNKIIKIDFENGLGILQARKTLREEFLQRDYKYLIMFDDDALIEETEPGGAKKFMEILETVDTGFGFLQYKAAQLNGCAISHDLYLKEPMVNVDPQKDEGYEDTIFSMLLHYKYAGLEFNLTGIKCVQFNNKEEPAKSTWLEAGHKYADTWANTEKIISYIRQYKEFPKNWKSFCTLKSKAQKNKPKTYLGYSYLGL